MNQLQAVHSYMMRFSYLIILVVLVSACKSKNKVAAPVQETATTTFSEVAANRDSLLAAQGILWFASGNEPFWKLEIHDDQRMLFEEMNGNKRESKLNDKILLNDGEGFRYVLQTEAGLLEVRFRENGCTDNMSGKRSAFSVQVNLDYQQFEGCGGPTFNHLLAGNWQMVSLDQKSLTGIKSPQLTIEPEAGRWNGNDGCNQFTGGIRIQGNRLIAGPIAATKMACPEQQSPEATAFLSDKDLRYELKADQLIIRNAQNQEMLLQRILEH